MAGMAAAQAERAQPMRSEEGRRSRPLRILTGTLCNMSDMERYRQQPGIRAFRVMQSPGTSCPWRVAFIVDGDEVGKGQYQTAEQADDAGVQFMFAGWGHE